MLWFSGCYHLRELNMKAESSEGDYVPEVWTTRRP